MSNDEVVDVDVVELAGWWSPVGLDTGGLADPPKRKCGGGGWNSALSGGGGGWNDLPWGYSEL